MRILRLDLLAFGPFTGLSLDLAAAGDGLLVLYGPNEAGKSSALRALRQLLYGIPRISDDDFIHPYKKMRIGALLQQSDGARLEVIRRKAVKNPLRDADDDQPVDEALLRGFLGGIDEDVFRTMFGIGHEDLVRGGEEILQGGGDVGQALFSAGSGLSDLRRVQAALQAEAEALFTPAASTREINQAIAAFKENQKALRDAQLPGQDWEQHDTALRQALERRETVDRELQAREAEQHRLERIRDALPLIARREDRLEARKDLAGAVRLADDFGERRQRILTELRVAESSRDQAREDLEETGEAQTRLQVDEAVLDRADRIDSLYRELGGFQAAVRDRVKLQEKRDILWSGAREILSGLRKDLTLEQAETLRIERPRAARIHELGKQYERMMERLETAREALPRVKTRVQALEEDLASRETPLEVEDLDRGLERARDTSPLEKAWQQESAEIAHTRQALEGVLEKQPFWKGSLEALGDLPLPSSATLDALDQRLDEAARAHAQAEAEIRGEEEALAEAAGELKGLALEGEVPTEEDLKAARSRREDLWAQVRHALETGERPDAEDGPRIEAESRSATLESAYEDSVRRADDVADRLRREADRVARKAKLVADQETRRERLERLKARLAEAEAEKQEAETAWQAAWQPAGITPGSPREMRAWLQEQQNHLERFAALRERERKARALEQDLSACRRDLGERLQALGLVRAEEGETLSDLTARCRRIVEQQKTLAAAREKLRAEKHQQEQAQEEASVRLDQAEKDLARWQAQWEDAVRPLGLGVDALPAQAGVVMEDLAALFEKLKEAGILQKRVQGIDRDSAAYEDKVNALLDQVAPDLTGRPVDQAVPELHARLNHARETASQEKRLKAQQARQEERLREVEERIRDLRFALEAMCEEAQCATPEALAEAEARSQRLRQVEADLEHLEEQLRGLSGGRPVEAFVEEARAVDPDEIDGRIQRLAERIPGLREEQAGLGETIGEERNELSRMDGSSRAAEIAEEGQSLLAGLERGVENYARLRLASTVLARAVERYRERYQGPVLQRTNVLFSRLTLGRFEGVRAEVDEQGTPRLVGVRPGTGEIVPVSGMSDGTADQLYLALRLASLEAYLETSEPMPFVVDDILIKFDDDRARAALEILADLSRKTQVIFFTHHRHLVDLAQDLEMGTLVRNVSF